MKYKILSFFLLVTLNACYSANIVKNVPLKESNSNVTNTHSMIPNNIATNTNENTSPNSNSENTSTISKNYNPTSGGGSSSSHYGGNTSSANTTLTKEELVIKEKVDIAKKVLNSFNGDKSKTLVLLKLFGFSYSDLQKAGYSKEEIDSSTK